MIVLFITAIHRKKFASVLAVKISVIILAVSKDETVFICQNLLLPEVAVFLFSDCFDGTVKPSIVNFVLEFQLEDYKTVPRIKRGNYLLGVSPIKCFLTGI